MTATKQITWNSHLANAGQIIAAGNRERLKNPPTTRHAVFDTLYSGQSLLPMTRLKSANRKAFLVLQQDRNLVLYQTETHMPVWASGTQDPDHFGEDNPFQGALVMQGDGNLVIQGIDGVPFWSSAQGNYTLPQAGAYLRVQDDGNLVIYVRNPLTLTESAIWSTETPGFSSQHKGTGLFDYIGDGTAAVGDVISSVVTRIPGSAWLGEKIQDFARTSIGKALFRGVASRLVMDLLTEGFMTSAILGAGMAGGAFVAPGLLRGESIDKAFLKELQYVATKLGAEVNAGDIIGQLADPVTTMVSDQFSTALAQLDAWADAHNVDFDLIANQTDDARSALAREIDVESMAAGLGIKPEIMKLAVDAATRTQNAAGLVFDDSGDVHPDTRQVHLYIPPTPTTKVEGFFNPSNFGSVPGHTSPPAALPPGKVAPLVPASRPGQEPPPTPSPHTTSQNNNLMVGAGVVAVAAIALLLTSKK